MSDEIIDLIQQCLNQECSIEIVKCGPYAKPDKPYLCRVQKGMGTAQLEHLVYGDNASNIMEEAMQYVLTNGFTQKQDRYGL